MDRKNSILAALGLVAALAGGALMAAAPPAGTGTGGDKDKTEKKDKDAAKEKKHDKAPAGATVGQKAPEFHFTDFNGKSHSLTEFAGKTVVLEWMNPGCPVCKGKMESGAVAKMMTDTKALDPNVVFVFVNSTNAGMGGSAEASSKYLKDNKIEAIGFWEGDGAVGHLYGAQTTPHIFVIDGKGVLAYQGAIDDAQTDKKGVNYVVNTVQALKAGKAPSPATTKAYGCSVKYSGGK